MKNSFLIYKDWLPLIQSLPEKKRLQFYDLLFAYDGLNYSPKIEDAHLKGIFTFVLDKLKENERKYDEVVEKRRVAGSKGGKQKQTKGSKSKQVLPNGKQKKQELPDTVTETDTVTVTENEKEMNINSEMTKIWKAAKKEYVWDSEKDSFSINTLREKITKQLKQIGEDPHFPIAEESIIAKWQELIQNRNEYWLKQDLSMMANYFNRFESECRLKSNKRGMVY